MPHSHEPPNPWNQLRKTSSTAPIRTYESTFVKAGRYRFSVGEESFEVGPGDAFVIPSGVTHGCKLIEEAGVLLDTFTLRREGFL